MDGVHDLGGMQGFGPVVMESDEPVFHLAWERRVFGLGALLLLGGLGTTNRFRSVTERMDPAHYLSSSYYEHWLTTLATMLVERGDITVQELETSAGGGFPLCSEPSAPNLRCDAPAPRAFAVGEVVRVRRTGHSGHTRCPRYLRGRRGSVVRLDGDHPLPDVEVSRSKRHSEPTYSVRFAARELWGAEAEPATSVCVDLWHSYLEAAK